MTAPSLVQQVLDRCQDALFTGTVRVHTRQAEGELWLLSGILERVRFGVSVDDEAMGRLLAADTPKVELFPCLPNPRGGFRKGHPMEGALGHILPVDLLRFCEMHSLTCTLELRSGDSLGEVVYRLGELVSVRCDAGTDRGVAQMLEWNTGRYRFVLPSVEVPKLSPVRLAPPPSAPHSEEEPAPDSSAWRTASNEALKRKAEEAYAKSLAEEKRLAEEAEATRLAEEAEATRLTEEAEAKRIAEEAEAKRLAEEAEAKAKRLAGEAEAMGEAKRLAEEAEAKAKRLAEEALATAKRLAEEANAEAKRLAEEANAEAKRLADEAQAKRAEAARTDATARHGVEAKRRADEKRGAKAKRKLEEKTRAEDGDTRRRAALAEQKRTEEEASRVRTQPAEAAKEKAYSVVVRVRRVTTEYLHVSVPVTPSVMKKAPAGDGSYEIDMDALFAEAVRAARAPSIAWKPEGEPVVEVHPTQKPPSTPVG